MSFTIYELPKDVFNCSVTEAATENIICTTSTGRDTLFKAYPTIVSRPDGEVIAELKLRALHPDQAMIYGINREPLLKRRGGLFSTAQEFRDDFGRHFYWKKDKVSPGAPGLYTTYLAANSATL